MHRSIAENWIAFQRFRLQLQDTYCFGVQPCLGKLKALGIPVDQITKFQPHCEMFEAWISGGPGGWELGIDGQEGFVGRHVVLVPCLDEFEEAVDFVAQPLDGRPAFALLGRIPILGLDRLVRPQVPGRVPVHETPLAWLRSCCDGCCVIDWVNAAPTLRSQPATFLAGSAVVARELREAGVQTKILTKRIRQEQAA